MWKVRILWYTHRLFLINLQISAPDNWSVESIVTGRLRVPRTEVDLQEISIKLYGSSDMDEELGETTYLLSFKDVFRSGSNTLSMKLCICQ